MQLNVAHILCSSPNKNLNSVFNQLLHVSEASLHFMLSYEIIK